jgi:hypothetical protein
MNNSVDGILDLNLPVLPPEASTPMRFDTSRSEWLEYLQGLADVFLEVHPDLMKNRMPVEVPFVMHD